KNAKVEIVTGVLIPPDFTTFWTQARQQGFRQKAVTVGKALLFPRSVEALGAIGEGLTTEVWWSPNHPFKSSLTGASSRDLAAAYTNATKKQWTQPMGFIHALFEVAFDALSRSGKAGDREALREAIKATTKKTIVGDISWAKGPVGNVAKTPLVGGQWGKGKQFAYDLTIVNNERAHLSDPAAVRRDDRVRERPGRGHLRSRPVGARFARCEHRGHAAYRARPEGQHLRGIPDAARAQAAGTGAGARDGPPPPPSRR